MNAAVGSRSARLSETHDRDYSGLLRRLARSFYGSGIWHNFTGEVALQYYGRPRSFRDVDILVYLGELGFTRLLEALREAKLVVPAQKLRKAFANAHRILSLDDKRTTYTVDIMVLSRRTRRRFVRSRRFALALYLTAPEPYVAAKLTRIKNTTSTQLAYGDRADIASILEKTPVDTRLLEAVAKRDSTLALLREIAQYTVRAD